jgi:hypothetical protein
MPISRSSKIDFAAISAEMGDIAERWFNGQITIVDPDVEGQTWDPATNTYTGSSEVELWSGYARIQPIGVGENPQSDYAFSSAGIRRVRIQVKLDPARSFIRKGLRVRVTDGGADAELEKLDFVVTNAVNSSYAWLRTIECEADTKNTIA